MGQVAVGQGELEFTGQANSTQLQRSQTDIRLQVNKVRYGTGQERPPAFPVSLRLHTTQDRQRGHMQVQQLQFNAPILLRLEAHGATSDWGKTADLDLSIPECQVQSLLALVPKPYRHDLPFSEAQGQITLKLTSQGRVPTLPLWRKNLPHRLLKMRLQY